MLQHVVEVDPNYAPAWEELGVRCYYDADYSNGGEKRLFQHAFEHRVGTGAGASIPIGLWWPQVN